ncbi:MAG TPA: hypothetical protein VLG12_01420 [Candidatus Saccharimonadales bacterium]|nr:hypothetical protein [Candidatus Saccharimonadales bacterium]
MDASENIQQEKQQSTSHKKAVNVWMIISIILFIALCSLSAYTFGKSQVPPPERIAIQPTIQQFTPTQEPTTAITVSPTSTATMTGTATGRLCYPSSLIPKGTITAKNITTNELVTQDYPGTDNGGSSTYTLILKPGTYHMKYTPQAYSSVIGFYTDYSTCVNNPSGSNCSGQKTRPLLPVTIEAGKTVQDVNLCDFYYSPDSPPTF